MRDFLILQLNNSLSLVRYQLEYCQGSAIGIIEALGEWVFDDQDLLKAILECLAQALLQPGSNFKQRKAGHALKEVCSKSYNFVVTGPDGNGNSPGGGGSNSSLGLLPHLESLLFVYTQSLASAPAKTHFQITEAVLEVLAQCRQVTVINKNLSLFYCGYLVLV